MAAFNCEFQSFSQVIYCCLFVLTAVNKHNTLHALLRSFKVKGYIIHMFYIRKKVNLAKQWIFILMCLELLICLLRGNTL